MSMAFVMKSVTKRESKKVSSIHTACALFFAVVMLASVSSASAETEVMPEMDHSNMQGMDHGSHEMKDESKDESKDENKDASKDKTGEAVTGHAPGQEMDHSNMHGMDHGVDPAMDHSNMTTMEQSVEQSMEQPGSHDMSAKSMQGGSPPADARDPHAYSNGLTFGPGPKLRLADEHQFASLLFDRLESARTTDTVSTVYDLQAWYGRDYDRAVLKAEGHIAHGKVEGATTELLWGHALTAYWDTQLGMRYDSGEGVNRGWLAFGVQGLAPYWFEVDATAYIGTEGRTALSLEAEYEMPFTQRLILQPRVEASIYGKEDTENGIGAGLSELVLGVRLRYEIKRELGPYIGVEWESLRGDTASMARDAGNETNETLYVAGIRMWF